MKQVLIKGKLVLKELKPNFCKLLFTPENPALLKKIEGCYNYDDDRALVTVMDGIEIIEQEFNDKKVQLWWEKFSSCNGDNNHEPYIEHILTRNKEYSGFIFTNRIIQNNEIIAFVYKGRTDVSDGIKMELNPFIIQKSLNSKVIQAMDLANSQFEERSVERSFSRHH